MMSDTIDQYIDLPVGEILRRVRLQHKLSIAQVEQHTRILPLYLEALENGDFERLPGQVYVIGFVKSYSEYLGLDSAKMVQLLKKQTGHQVKKPVNVFPVVNEEQKAPSMKIVIASAFLLAVILLAWKLGNPSLHSDEIPTVPKELAQQMTAPQKPEEEKAPAQAEANIPAAKPHPVVLKATQDVWIEIRDGAGQPVFSRVLKAGEEYWVPEEAVDYKMTTGNAGGLNVIVEGVALPPIGKVGDVERNVSLNPSDLKGVKSDVVVPAVSMPVVSPPATEAPSLQAPAPVTPVVPAVPAPEAAPVTATEEPVTLTPSPETLAPAPVKPPVPKATVKVEEPVEPAPVVPPKPKKPRWN